MPCFSAVLVFTGHEILRVFEAADFHSAAEIALRMADEEGGRLSEIEPGIDLKSYGQVNAEGNEKS